MSAHYFDYEESKENLLSLLEDNDIYLDDDIIEEIVILMEDCFSLAYKLGKEDGEQDMVDVKIEASDEFEYFQSEPE